MTNKEIKKLSKKYKEFVYSNPHDAFFKQEFSQRRKAEEIVRFVLPEHLLNRIDFVDFQISPETFVDEILKFNYSDLLFQSKSEDIMIYFLYEHKSYYDIKTPMQILRYIIKIWDKFNLENPLEKLPLVIPVVFYHGSSPWEVKNTDIFNLMKTEIAEDRIYVPDFQYILFNLEKLSVDLLEFSRDVRYTLAVMRDRRDQERLNQWFKKFLLDFNENIGELFVFYYYLRFGTILDAEVIEQTIKDEKMGLKNITFEDLEVGTSAWKSAKKSYEKGIEKGIEKTRLDFALKLLKDYTDDKVSEMSDLPLEKIKELRLEYEASLVK